MLNSKEERENSYDLMDYFNKGPLKNRLRFERSQSSFVCPYQTQNSPYETSDEELSSGDSEESSHDNGASNGFHIGDRRETYDGWMEDIDVFHEDVDDFFDNFDDDVEGGSFDDEDVWQFPYQVPHGQMTYYPYAYGYGTPMQGQWMGQGTWNSNGYQMPPVTPSAGNASVPPPLPSLPPPLPPPPPPPAVTASYEPPPPGSIKFTIPPKGNKLQKPKQENKSPGTIQVPQYPTNPQVAVSPLQDTSSKSSEQVLAQTKTSGMPNEWPPNLRRYAERCFTMCQSNVDKDLVDLILRGKISSAQRQGIIHTKDWDSEPVPNLSRVESKVPISGVAAGVKAGTSGFNVSPVKAGVTIGGSSSGLRLAAISGQDISPFKPAPGGIGVSPVKPVTNDATPFKNGIPSNLGNTSFKTGASTLGISATKAPIGTKQNQISFQLKGKRKAIYGVNLRGLSSSSSSSSSRSTSHSPVGRRRSSSRSTSRSRSRSPSHSRLSPLSRSSPTRFKKPTKSQQKKQKRKNQNQNQKKMVGATGKVGAVFGSVNRTVLGANWTSPDKLRKRQARFQVPKKIRLSALGDSSLYREDVTGEEDWSNLLIVGTCCEVEKPFFRLTAAPDPSTVRPVHILKKALYKVKTSWIANPDYRSCCDQMKSIRQDLTVQGIRDSFTVEVYETHARLALEAADHEEFNQCQTQLKALHHELGGKNLLEFIAYRILYYIFTKSTMDLNTTMASLTTAEKSDECVAHALEVRSSWALANFRRFFRLYNHAPRMSAHLISWFADRERKLALKTLIKAYRPNIPVELVTTQLGFPTPDAWYDFAKELPIVYSDDSKAQIDCKASAVNLTAW
uniref:EOG090X0431 n=1 Tax=Daphnia hispanica TaxID=575233 RepID=A0A4Y7M579_9CRUS|nr:EOG090X0431 [Daphnia hispanica]